ncbi:MAG: DNA alkylation repair protein [Candidatus Kapaibacterium sp.]
MKSNVVPTRFVDTLVTAFERHRDAERAVAMSAYMRNRFAFYGIASVPRAQILKSVCEEAGFPSPDEARSIVRLLWELPERELQYAAVDIMLRLKRHFTTDDVPLLEDLITAKSWWDTVDSLAPRIAGPVFAADPANMTPVIRRWIHHPDFWLNRSAIILQLGYKDRTDTDLLTHAIRPHLGSREFFLRKAICWALRQYSYTDARWVTEFVASHDLSPLSEREALKALRRTAERVQRARR